MPVVFLVGLDEPPAALLLLKGACKSEMVENSVQGRKSGILSPVTFRVLWLGEPAWTLLLLPEGPEAGASEKPVMRWKSGVRSVVFHLLGLLRPDGDEPISTIRSGGVEPAIRISRLEKRTLLGTRWSFSPCPPCALNLLRSLSAP